MRQTSIGVGRRRRCYRAPPIHRLDQNGELRRCEGHRAIHNGRPDEAALLKTLGNQPHAGAVPIEAFEIVAAFATKDEEVAAERIGTDHLLRLGRQAVKPVAQIDRTARKKYLCARRQADHASPFMARSTRDSAFSLTNASTLTRVPFRSVISIDPPLPSAGGGSGAEAGSGGASNAGPLDVLPWTVPTGNELNILGRARRNSGRLARRTPIVEQALRHAAPPRDQAHFATFRVDLGEQCRLLVRAPNAPPVRRPQDIYVRQNSLLLESRERLQRSAGSPDAAPRRYTAQAGRLLAGSGAVVLGGREAAIELQKSLSLRGGLALDLLAPSSSLGREACPRSSGSAHRRRPLPCRCIQLPAQGKRLSRGAPDTGCGRSPANAPPDIAT